MDEAIRNIKVENKQEFQKEVATAFDKLSMGPPITVKLFNFPPNNKILRDQVTGEISKPRIKKLLATNAWFGCYYKEPKTLLDAYTTLFDDVAFRVVKCWFADDGIYGGIEIFDTVLGRPLNKFLQYVTFVPMAIISPHNYKLLRFDYILNIDTNESE